MSNESEMLNTKDTSKLYKIICETERCCEDVIGVLHKIYTSIHVLSKNIWGMEDYYVYIASPHSDLTRCINSCFILLDSFKRDGRVLKLQRSDLSNIDKKSAAWILRSILPTLYYDVRVPGFTKPFKIFNQELEFLFLGRDENGQIFPHTRELTSLISNLSVTIGKDFIELCDKCKIMEQKFEFEAVPMDSELRKVLEESVNEQ